MLELTFIKINLPKVRQIGDSMSKVLLQITYVILFVDQRPWIWIYDLI